MMIPSDVMNWLPSVVPSSGWQYLGGHGGYSGAKLWRGTGAQQAWCLRCWPQVHPSSERLMLLHRWLQHLGQAGLAFVPAPLTGANGRSWFECQPGRWECTPWLPGKADFHEHPSAQRLGEAARGLARLHRQLQDFRGQTPDVAPAVTERLRLLRQLQTGEFDQLRRLGQQQSDLELRSLAEPVLSAVGRFGPGLGELLASQGLRPRVLQPCVRDIWHDHLLFEGSKLTGIVDYGAMNVDDVATDLARMFGSLIGDRNDLWLQARKAYDDIHPLSDPDWELARLLDRSGCLLGAVNWLRWLWLEQRTFEDMDRVRARLRELGKRLSGWDNPGGSGDSLTA